MNVDVFGTRTSGSNRLNKRVVDDHRGAHRDDHKDAYRDTLRDAHFRRRFERIVLQVRCIRREENPAN